MKDRAYEIPRNHGYGGYQRALASMVYNFFDKKTGSGAMGTSRMRASVNERLVEELHKPVSQKFKRRKVYARFKDVWAADLAEMKSQFSKNKNVKYLLCAIDVFTKYPWVKPLKDKNCKTVINAFLELVNESNHKPNNYGLIKEENFIINFCKNG